MGFGYDNKGISGTTKEPLTLVGPISQENKYTFLIVYTIFFLLSYSIPNHYHLYTPQQLSFTPADATVPLVPWTIFIYLSEYIYFTIAFLMIRNDTTLNRYLWSLSFVGIISAVFFVFFPTTYPRHEFPIPAGTSNYVRMPFEWLRSIDDPSNSFPSLHVGSCFVTALLFIHEARWKLSFFLFWSVAISISTLTTKQHYLVDVVAGTALASVSAYIFIIKARYKAPDAPLVRLKIGNWGN